MGIEVSRADVADEGVQACLAESAALMAALFPPEDNHGIAPGAEDPELCMFAAREGGRVIGTAAMAPRDGYGEVKAMFVSPGLQGHGIGAQLLAAVEDEARARGIDCLRLETGAPLAAACRLYRKVGYRDRAAFGEYADGTTSIFMEKTLTPLSPP
ncbi:GNAT family N-acetyltransferase [Palleronia abyssalis]|uniref:Putative N-acetyltransferase YsnE n=1 Tax=Palleronia abyssalis TaxID=1501240 RepID=A0A2R8BTX1_9RHOB|nr:GNAT family N-acetyltransferase [Palleronia abyssalis]SPJ23601.1 putative N-acetyltransferase YsnE [Palleronia abyssalis]